MIGKLSDEKLALKVNELKSELDEIISKTKLLEDSAESYGMMVDNSLSGIHKCAKNIIRYDTTCPSVAVS